MLAEERFREILKIVNDKKTVTVQELTALLQTSESTIRRDLTTLHQRGALIKVHGGATTAESETMTRDADLSLRSTLNKEAKAVIGKYAASLIREDDFVYLDAGTTTGLMLEYLAGVRAAFVTNAVSHAQTLAKMGIRVYLIGGELKSSTEAVVGSQAMQMIQMYHFTKGFFGTNGVSKRHGFTTPDPNEALVKQEAMRQTERCYVLADSQKFGMVSSVTFGVFEEATILTETEPPEGFSGSKNIRVAK